MRETITAYVTTYALTSGILVVEGEVDSQFPGMLSSSTLTAHGENWHRSLEEAMARAEKMRENKIASLRRSLKKMESLKVRVVPACSSP